MQDSSGFDKVPNPPTDNDWPTGMPRPTVVGQRVGPYKLLQEIGEGGGGKVFLAEQDQPVRRRVALKIIKLGMDTEEVIARFEAERQALAMMDHPNIARVFDAGATETGRPYFVMELVRGEPITKFCDDNKLSIAERLKLFILVCNAVQHAHQKGIIHRDIKPSNVLVSMHDGVPTPKIIDFGIAKATGARLTDKTYYTAIEQFVGTPAYMSPEQAAVSNVDVDTRSDIYSLGVLLYQLLTGCTPLDYERLQEAGVDEIRRAIREEEPPRPSARLSTISNEELATTAKARSTEPAKLAVSLRGDLDWIVMRCLEKDRARRYDTASALAQDLQHFLANEPVTARPPNALYLLQKMARRHRVMFVSVAAISAALVIGLGAAIWSAYQASVERDRADEQAILAEKAMKETAVVLGRTDYLVALNLVQDDHLPEAVAHLVRALRASPDNPPAAALLNSILTMRNWLVPVATETTTQPILQRGGSRGANGPGRGGAGQNFAGGPGPRGAADANTQTSPDGTRTLRVTRGISAQVLDAMGKEISPLITNVATANFNADGRWILVIFQDRAVRIMDAVTGQFASAPMRLEGSVISAELSADGRSVVTKSRMGGPSARDRKETAETWSYAPEAAVVLALRAAGNISNASESPDGKRLATISGNNTLQIWEAATGQPVTPAIPDESPVENNRGARRGGVAGRLSFSPDGRRILSVANDRTVRVLDAATGQTVPPAWPQDSGITAAAFNPDGTKILTAGATARIWNASTGAALFEFAKEAGPQGTALLSLDGKTALTTTQAGEVQVWNAATGEVVGEAIRLDGPNLAASFSPDGARILTSTSTGARVWDAATGQPVSALVQSEGNLNSAAFSADGRWVVTSGQGTARIWDADTGLAVSVSMASRGVRFSPDGQRLLVLGEDGDLHVWPFSDKVGPAWILDLAEKLAQCRLDATGSLVFYPGKPIEELRKLAAQEKDANQPMVQWARKLLGVTPAKN